jgi:sialic acid synthase
VMDHPVKYERPRLIAEIGCNHGGSLQLAKEMISVAASFCKVDVVKFQKRSPRELLSESQYDAPHPNAMHAFGDSYGEHRQRLEFTISQHAELMRWAAECGTAYSSSVWDLTSAREIASLDPALIKIGSATNCNFDVMAYLCDQYRGELHLSLGMTSRDEEQRIVKFFEDRGRNQDLVLYSCTSGYPVAFGDVCLLEIVRLHRNYGNCVKCIGFSGHHLGFAIDVAAYTLGATWIERHFTLDRTSKGTDHAASLEPDGMRRLKRNLEATHNSLTYKSEEILQVELPQREKLKAIK